MTRPAYPQLVRKSLKLLGLEPVARRKSPRRVRPTLALEILEGRELMHSLGLAAGAAAAGDAYESDNTYLKAKTIRTDGTAQVHSIHTASDVDWVKFTLSKASNVTIQTDGSSGDTQMWLYASNGTLVQFDDDSGNGLFSRIDRSGSNALGAGTYYVAVDEYGQNSTIARYTLSVKAQVQSNPGTTGRYMLTDNYGGRWTDVEKSPTNSDDDEMCWAATASNMLVWAGWGATVGNPTADQVFQYYCNHFSDAGSRPEFGIQWWFNGTNPAQGYSGWAQIQVAGGNFFSSQSVSSYCHVQDTDSQAMQAINQYLHAGDAVGLGVQGPGGHAITCWGFDYNPSTGAYRGIWVTDSDNSKNLTNPPDQLVYYAVAQSSGRWYLQNFYGSNSWYIDEVIGLDRRPTSVTRGIGAPATGAATFVMAKGMARMSEAAAVVGASFASAQNDPAPGPQAPSIALLPSAEEDRQTGLAAKLATAVDRAMATLSGDRLAMVNDDAQLVADVAQGLDGSFGRIAPRLADLSLDAMLASNK